MAEGGARLLDPRWHQVGGAARRLYEQLEPGMEVTAIAMTVRADDGTEMYYAADPGGTRIERRLLTDLHVIAEATLAGTIDITPPEQVPGG